MINGGNGSNRGGISLKAAAVMQFGSKYISMGAQLVITALLARLIAPEDFGLVAIVTVFTGLFSLLSDMGVSAAIVQYRDLSEEDYGALFGFSIVMGFSLMIAFCAASPLIATFYSDPRLILLCCAASPMLLFATLNMVPSGLMLKERRFDLIGIRLVVATALSGGFAIFLAFFGAGCYALVVQTVLSLAIVLVWNLAARRIRFISLNFKKPMRRIFSYSAYQFGFSLINYFSRNLDNMLIGRFMGSSQLGFYDKAYKLTGYPLSAFSSVIGSVVQPYMAEHQDDPDVIFNCFMKVEKFLSLVGVFVAVIFLSGSAEIIQLFYGPGWEPAIPVFSVLAVSVYFQMMGNPAGAFFQSLGRTDFMFKVGLINTSLTAAGLAAGLIGGSIETVSYGIAAAYCMHMVTVAWFLVRKGFRKSFMCLKVFLPEVCVGVVAAVLTCLIFRYIHLPIIGAFIAKALLASFIILVGYVATGQFVHLKSFKLR